MSYKTLDQPKSWFNFVLSCCKIKRNYCAAWPLKKIYTENCNKMSKEGSDLSYTLKILSMCRQKPRVKCHPSG